MAESGVVAEAVAFAAIVPARREWLWLWLHGRFDGWRRIPMFTNPSGEFLTPQIEALSRHALEVFDTERRRMLTDIAAIRVRGERLRAELPDLQGALAHSQERHDRAVEQGPGEGRRTGEDALDEAVVVRRRLREHDRSLTALGAEVRAGQSPLRMAEAELAALPDQIERREAEAHLRVAQFSHFTQRRMAVYWRSLLRAHRRRTPVMSGWKPLPAPRPAWAAQTSGVA